MLPRSLVQLTSCWCIVLLQCYLWHSSQAMPKSYSRYNKNSEILRKRLADNQNNQPNPEENRDFKGVHLIDGDILVRVETRSGPPPNNHEALSFSQSYAPSQTRSRTNKDRNWVWTKRTIPYVIDSAYDRDTEMKNEILRAMQEFHSQTCVRFKPRRNEVDYVNIVPLSGCYSQVGRQGGLQNISLSDECRTKGTILHELMHSLGFWHEQSRWDRDDYVQIDLDNVSPMHRMNFRKYPVTKQTTLGTPYDYGSILHYRANAFAIDPSRPTIIPLSNDPVAALEMGQRERLSPIDIFKINTVYHCNITRCADPGLPENGFRQGSSFDVGATMTYSCRHGFTLIGSHQRYCMDNGEWTSYTPSCVAGRINYCDFEDPNICGWTQDGTDQTDWTRTHAGTPSDGTGPLDDYTMKTTEGHYMYLEASQPTKTGDRARLISPMIQPFAKRMCLKFHYSMYGQGMGSLNAIQREQGQTDYVVFRETGNKGEGWFEGSASIKPIGQFQIVFESVRGSSYLSDIAIDDIILADCDALDINVLHIPDEFLNTPVSTEVLFHCDFETDLCGLREDPVGGFTLHTGHTMTSRTGPECDHTTCNGKYIYFEASTPRTPGDSARIISPELMGVGIKCATFYYSMYGSTMGSLNIYLNEEHGTNLIWTKSGDQGAGWHRAQVEIQPTGPFSISYESVRGQSFRSDIGIDDLSVTNGRCYDLISGDRSQSGMSAIGRLNCDFETDTCGWQDFMGSNFNWVRNNGPTDTPWTGPLGDHTSGMGGNGMYIYVEASNHDDGETARMESPLLPVDGDGYCLTFWYHMIGQHIGILRILKAAVTGHTHTLWQRQGQQTPHGHNNTIAINSTELPNLWLQGRTYVNSDAPFRIYIEGQVGGSYRGDIAVDDVTLEESNDANCPTL